MSKAYCKVGEGWKCVITRTTGPDAGKVFVNCGGNCTCIVDSTEGTKPILVQNVEKVEEGAFCECGEGWSCVVSKIEGPEAKKTFAECTGSCTCVTNAC